MDSLYELSLAMIMIVGGLLPIEIYRQSDPKKKENGLRFLAVGVVFLIAGLFYLFWLLSKLF